MHRAIVTSERFEALSPWRDTPKTPLLKLEKENFASDGDCHQLYAYLRLGNVVLSIQSLLPSFEHIRSGLRFYRSRRTAPGPHACGSQNQPYPGAPAPTSHGPLATSHCLFRR